MPGTAPESWTTAYQEALQDAYHLADRKTLDPGTSARIRALVAYAAEIRTGLAAGLLPTSDTIMTPVAVPLLAVPMRDEQPRPLVDPCSRCGSYDHHSDNHAESLRRQPCRLMTTRYCPASRPTGCPGECARLESDDETPWLASTRDADPAATATLTAPPVVPGQGGEPRIMCHCGATGAAHPHGLYDSCEVDTPTPRDACWCGGPETPVHTLYSGPVCGPQ